MATSTPKGTDQPSSTQAAADVRPSSAGTTKAAATPAKAAAPSKPAKVAKPIKPVEPSKVTKAAGAPKTPNPAKVKKSVAPAKVAAKPAAKAIAAAPTAQPAVTVAAPAKLRKPALVRDSFTMPEADFALIAALKKRAIAFQRPAKKSELLRAGLQALAALDDGRVRKVLEGLAEVKTGRPKKH